MHQESRRSLSSQIETGGHSAGAFCGIVGAALRQGLLFGPWVAMYQLG